MKKFTYSPAAYTEVECLQRATRFMQSAFKQTDDQLIDVRARAAEMWFERARIARKFGTVKS
jgi:hypothetical protein